MRGRVRSEQFFDLIDALEAHQAATGRRRGGHAGRIGGWNRDGARRAAVARGLVPWSTTLEECMTHDPISITPSTDTLEASHIMLERGFRHLPVLEEGRLVGILSLRDLLRAAEAERILRAKEEERGDWRRRSTTG